MLARVITSVLGLLAVAVIAAPALAGTATFHDPRGDAVARHDVTRVTIRNEPGFIAVSARVRNLRSHRAQFFGLVFKQANDDAEYLADTERRASGRTRTELMRSTTTGYETVVDTLRCEVRTGWQPARDRVWLRFSRDCIDGHGGFRAFVAMGDLKVSASARVDRTRKVWVPYD